MADWIELFSTETAATIEGLTGQRPEVSLKNIEPVTDISNIIAPMSISEVNVSGKMKGKISQIGGNERKKM